MHLHAFSLFYNKTDSAHSESEHISFHATTADKHQAILKSSMPGIPYTSYAKLQTDVTVDIY